MKSVMLPAAFVILIVGCSSFGGGTDAPSTPGDAGSDASSDGSVPNVTGTPQVPPNAPRSVTPIAIPIVTTVTTLAGSSTVGHTDGTGAAASFGNVDGVAASPAGMIYVADQTYGMIRAVTPAGAVTTLAGSGNLGFADGSGSAASFSRVANLATDTAGNIYVADTDNNRIRRVTPSGVVTTFCGAGTKGYADGAKDSAMFDAPLGITVGAAGTAYVADYNNFRIRQVSSSGSVTTLAGSGVSGFADGTGSSASFKFPRGLAVDGAGAVLLGDGTRIRKVTPAGVVSTLAGSATVASTDGIGTGASFSSADGVAIDAEDNVYVVDFDNLENRLLIRRITPAGSVTTIAGGASGFEDGEGSTARFSTNIGQLATADVGVIYVADYGNFRLRKLTAVGIGQLSVTWAAPPAAANSEITGYTATALAGGKAAKTCTTTGPTSCTISGLTSGVSYVVTVTATNLAGTSPPSDSGSATPN